MSQAGETFFTSVGCMDGRVQDVVADYGRQKFGVKFADTITEAGLVGLLAKKNPDQSLIDSIKNKINISLEKHHSKGIVVHGHQECAGNPVDDEKHMNDVTTTVSLIKTLFPQIEVIPVFVKRDTNDQWTAEELPQTILV